MIYECCLDSAEKRLVVAKPEGWEWSNAERSAPFEIVKTKDIVSAEAAFDVSVSAPWGKMTVSASDIDPTLTPRSEPDNLTARVLALPICDKCRALIEELV